MRKYIISVPPNINMAVKSRRMGWVQYLERMEENNLASKAVKEDQHGRRNCGTGRYLLQEI
jgi:hypothetical protein